MHLTREYGNQESIILFILRQSTRISMTEITANLPKKGISVPPGQQILLQINHGIEDAIFTPRAPRIVDKVKPDKAKLNLNLFPCEVSRDSKDPPGLLRVKNISEIRGTMCNQFKLGHACNIAPSINNKTQADIKTCKERKAIVQVQVKIDTEFQNQFLEDLQNLILEFADVISWNSDLGHTTLGETYNDTGKNPAVKCLVKIFSPDVGAIVMEQIKTWLKEKTIVPICDKGTKWNSKILVVPKTQIEGQPKCYRCCLDFRALNAACVFTNKTTFMLHRNQETFHMLGRSYIFTTIDVTSAFHSIPIHKSHQYKTAFSVNGRTYYFAKTPFGLASAPVCLVKY